MIPMNSDYLYQKGYNSTFDEIFKDNTSFVKELTENPAYSDMLTYYSVGDAAYLNVVYLLLSSRYDGWSIAANSVSRFKLNLVERICSYGPTHKKKLEIQKKVRELSDAELQWGAQEIRNTAVNPETQPGESENGAPARIDFINGQNTSYHKRAPIDALMYQYNLLDKDLNGEFIEVFKPLFAKFIVKPIKYANYQED